MIVTRATTEHVDGILRLEGAFPPKQQWSRDSWLDELSGQERHTMVVIDETTHEVVGVSVFRRSCDVADLDRVVISPDYRRRGLARALVQAGVAWAFQQGAERVMLEVAEDNVSARTLYEAYGFREVARRDNYYGRGTTALVMELRKEGAHE